MASLGFPSSVECDEWVGNALFDLGLTSTEDQAEFRPDEPGMYSGMHAGWAAEKVDAVPYEITMVMWTEAFEQLTALTGYHIVTLVAMVDLYLSTDEMMSWMDKTPTEAANEMAASTRTQFGFAVSAETLIILNENLDWWHDLGTDLGSSRFFLTDELYASLERATRGFFCLERHIERQSLGHAPHTPSIVNYPNLTVESIVNRATLARLLDVELKKAETRDQKTEEQPARGAASGKRSHDLLTKVHDEVCTIFAAVHRRFVTEMRLEIRTTSGHLIELTKQSLYDLHRDEWRSKSPEERHAEILEHDQLSCYFGLLGQLNRNPRMTLHEVDLIIRARDWQECMACKRAMGGQQATATLRGLLVEIR